MGKFKLPLRVWILIIFLLLSVIAIKPTPFATGIQIKSVEPGSDAALAGLATGQIIKSVNDHEIVSVTDFKDAMEPFERQQQEFDVEVKRGNRTTIVSYNITDAFGFTFDENLTVLSSDSFSMLQKNDIVVAVNRNGIDNKTVLEQELDRILPKQVIKIKTDKGESAFLARGAPKINVGQAAKSNIRKGLDLEGGTRVLLKPIAENGTVSDKDVSDLISVLGNRLNVYGLTDMRIRSAADWKGETFILIEIAGVSKEEVSELIAKQGKFEAKIGNATVFSGGKKDITFVCRDDGSCSGVRSCNPSGGQEYCKFEFVIHLSPEAAKRHASITSTMDVVASESGHEVLSEHLDFYLDDKMVDSLQIGADLKGSETTQIAISGSGVAQDRNDAITAAEENMKKLQTILITGSLPFDLEIVKLDTISPVMGKEFVKNSFIVVLVALAGVVLVIFVRYRSLKILWPVIVTVASEIIIILGFAALIQWNLDMAAIAGIIATVGTGVDSQIIIIDEIMKGKSERFSNWKPRMKRAFFMIFAAYATGVAAMVPLWNAGAGLVRGFAVVTIIGISIGVFITRPAFAAIAEKLFKQD
ncbi:MAG TPA: PDZ domain-containing protein [Nanoarchaeota archaeon]|nr:PDZ domain-containing protein [Nanoarchaeota archaeon]